MAEGLAETKPDDLGLLGRERGATGAAAGLACFWTFLYLGPGRGVVALRNLVEQHGDGRLEYVRLVKGDVPEEEPGHGGGDPAESSSSPRQQFARGRVPAEQGRGHGQWCRLSAAAEARVLGEYKSVAEVVGKANSEGVDVLHASLERLASSHLLAGSSAGMPQSACARIPTLDYPIYSDDDIVTFDAVQDRLPFGIEKKMKIYLGRMRRHGDEAEGDLAPELRRLPYGLPASCDAFREAAFTGDFHGFGIVPNINEQQFVIGSGLENAWVRFDRGDLQTYDHDLDEVPVVEDGAGILFPVTHLWVDCSFPTAEYCLEWFCGRRCVVRKKFSLWPMPNPLFRRLIGWAAGWLQRATA